MVKNKNYWDYNNYVQLSDTKAKKDELFFIDFQEVDFQQ